jgi:hypothetical protein
MKMDFGIGGQVTWAAAIQALASLIGFIVIGNQVIQLRKNIRGATQDRLYAHYNEVVKLFTLKPYLYPYFYHGKQYSALDNNKENLREEIDKMSEAIFGVIEDACLQRENLSRDSQSNCWQSYAHERMRKSAEMEKFIDPNQNWYTAALRKVVNEFYAKGRPSNRGDHAATVEENIRELRHRLGELEQRSRMLDTSSGTSLTLVPTEPREKSQESPASAS